VQVADKMYVEMVCYAKPFIDKAGYSSFVGRVVKDAAKYHVECRRGVMLSKTAALARW